MKISRNFLADYLNIKKVDFPQLAEKMVALGHEYDSYYRLVDASKLVIGQVIDCQKHPNSKKLSVCQVDTGDGTKEIVCGATNVAAKQKVVVAKVGAILPGDFKIKKAKIAGVDSHGMICSFAELGFDKKFLKDSDWQEIMVLDDKAPVGADALEYLELDDEVIDFDLTTNRGDLLSMLGMAYEIGALYQLDVQYPPTDYQENNESIANKYSLNVTTDKCPLYLAKLVENIKITDSPQYIKNRLIACGIRPINNVVDISNYVMLETGQPIHFFDADKLQNIGVRMGKKEEVQTLDNQIRKADENDIVITNNDEAIALAGVMGGLSTEVTAETKNIIIESAIFHPSNIRNTAQKTLRSEASSRFEKGIAKERTFLAIKRACYLLVKHAEGEVAKDMLKHDKMPVVDKEITVSLEHINRILGMSLSIDAVSKVWERLQLPYQKRQNVFRVLIPPRRLDLHIAEDLIEEVGRFIGFNEIKSSLPKTTIKKGMWDEKMVYCQQIRDFLIAKGLRQTINYSLVSVSDNKMFSSQKPIALLDALSKERDVLRTSLLTSLLNTYNYNYARQIKDINIFEIGAIYQKEQTYQEENRLAILMRGVYLQNKWQKMSVTVDFFLLKGIIEELFNYLGLQNRYTFKVSTINNFHPYQASDIYINNQKVGIIGKVHPELANDVYMAEFDLEYLYDIAIKPIKYKAPFRYPSIQKDVAFLMDADIPTAEIEKVIKQAGGRHLEKITVFDVYEKEKQKSIAYSLLFRDETRTLNDEEVLNILAKIINVVEEKFNAQVRNK